MILELNIIENLWNLWKGSIKKNIFRVKNKEDLLPKLYRNLNFPGNCIALFGEIKSKSFESYEFGVYLNLKNYKN